MEETQSSRNKRIATNTLYLYVRSFIVMGISLYTSRVILKALGETDFGIYSLVGSAVIFFTFINSAMTSSTQRYLNVAIGKQETSDITKTFSASIIIQFIIVGIFLVLAETIGLWFVTNRLNIPADRENAAFWVYQITVLTTCINTLRSPLNAAIIAHERMDYFAKISIVEAVFKLAISFAILFAPFDRLIFYSLLLLLTNILIMVWCIAFCKKNFQPIRISRPIDNKIIKSMLGFSLWSLLGSGALMASNQGISMLLNVSYNILVNTALGIANQVNTAASTLVSNFQTAFMPQITKSYASNDITYLNKLIFLTSRYSFLLCFFISYPIFINCDAILDFWLSNYPEFTSGMVKVIIICVGFDALSGPLWMAAHAKGNIRNYQITVSLMLLFTLVACYAAVKMGCSPVVAYGSRILVLTVLLVYRLAYAKAATGLNINHYIQSVLYRCVAIIIISVPIALMMEQLSINEFLKIIIDFACASLLILLCGLKSNERVKVGSLCTNFYHKIIKS